MGLVLPAELLTYVHHGREERYLEYKERLDWSLRAEQCKLAKAALGMSNTRDGGVLVVGVRKDGTPVGLAEAEARAFTQDGVAAIVNEYAAPYAEPTVTIGHDPQVHPRWFVVVQVREFAEVPVICRRDGHELRQGAIYTRGRRIHETAEVRSEAEMREILDMAVEKGIRAFYRRLTAAGLEVSPIAAHRQQFEAQLGEL